VEGAMVGVRASVDWVPGGALRRLGPAVQALAKAKTTETAHRRGEGRGIKATLPVIGGQPGRTPTCRTRPIPCTVRPVR
ncbi:MAG: hypothetical protein ACRDVM_06875, partial [Acidimicrobiia bacterium]